MELETLNLKLCKRLVSQNNISRAQARERFDLLDEELASIPQDAEFISLGLGNGAELVAHYGIGDSEVWKLWTSDGSRSYWSPLNQPGEKL